MRDRLNLSLGFVVLETPHERRERRVHFRVQIEYYDLGKRTFAVQLIEKLLHEVGAFRVGHSVVTRVRAEFFKHHGIVVPRSAYMKFGGDFVIGAKL